MKSLSKKILLVEDDSKVCSFINRGLTEEGFEMTVAMTGKQGMEWASSTIFDLLILDIMLPDINGLDICKAVRQNNQHIPILFLTALGSAENIALGLDSGADDYLVKPFKFIELVARIKSLLRRSENFENRFVKEEAIYRFSDLQVNDTTKTVSRNNEEISLTSTEYRLLLMFLKNPYRVLSRTDILEHVWGVNFDIGTNVVDVYVNYLRKKLERNQNPRVIHTVIGMGYVLKESDEHTK
ncbi:DNA-binding response regulator, OmpR family, contains REC and winged-helix (wHTH) domain [Sinomicrobium oceani]|uniref:DNA-binding response regulator, OmpR family, contains REC and winged-helix (WHTH) domain n=1 Tax=Sinomicrobium oceani TaxID=1150368 RepID=A0A1K1R559_9FLAO|nr:response regulator transcription factor [Sinomicrobium oceani]SFW67157.1 DNA-binding response regulator, OmpR family, contains REC and winged-helix (wHTH) domain [Sinomicrobium oceani]